MCNISGGSSNDGSCSTTAVATTTTTAAAGVAAATSPPAAAGTGGSSMNGSSGSRDRGGSRSNGNGCGSRAYYMALLPLPPLFIYLFLVVFILSLYFKYFGEKQTGFVRHHVNLILINQISKINE